MSRTASIQRETKETCISVSINLDGTGVSEIETGIGFLDHMLNHIAKHGFFDITIKAKGDTAVDFHHTVEDVGIVLGQVFRKAYNNAVGTKRYGSFALPMDESLVLCSVDLCGRPYLNFDCAFDTQKIGEFDTELIEEFFMAFANNFCISLHIKKLSGKNSHHIAEAAFKSLAKALDEATKYDDRVSGVLSTKGVLTI